MCRGRALAALAAFVVAAAAPPLRADDFQISYAAGSRDAAGRMMGGTEMRVLAAHGGRLFAGKTGLDRRAGRPRKFLRSMPPAAAGGSSIGLMSA
jgi:hypothetical protein